MLPIIDFAPEEFSAFRGDLLAEFVHFVQTTVDVGLGDLQRVGFGRMNARSCPRVQDFQSLDSQVGMD